ncbi:unnamed protein product [Hyaloperonospora brassicae]|uniref:DHHA1 domain-containing protein n=1 Tax=Hyaloperonospora brassicae TaxID=162125 RepID=A0AAV0T919_HYABA|nr:unnamed protein product [Hyaloperonospora brassicae]
MHSEIDKLVKSLNKAIKLHDKKGVKIKFFSSEEYQRALGHMITVNSGRGANDKLNMFKILEEKMGKEGLTGLATTIAAKGGGHDQMAASALTTFLKQSEEAMPLSGGTRTLADRKKADALRVIV